MLRNSKMIDYDPNSIIQASKKVQIITSSKLRNRADNPDMASFNLNLSAQDVKNKANDYLNQIDSIKSDINKLESLAHQHQRNGGSLLQGGTKNIKTLNSRLSEEKLQRITSSLAPIINKLSTISPKTLKARKLTGLSGRDLQAIKQVFDDNDIPEKDTMKIIGIIKNRLGSLRMSSRLNPSEDQPYSKALADFANENEHYYNARSHPPRRVRDLLNKEIIIKNEIKNKTLQKWKNAYANSMYRTPVRRNNLDDISFGQLSTGPFDRSSGRRRLQYDSDDEDDASSNVWNQSSELFPHYNLHASPFNEDDFFLG
jgi:hypothetical protein